VVKRSGHDVTRDELLKFLGSKMVKWWVPDDVVFVDELPRTATGKFSKLTLRRQFRDYRLPDA
jgi:acyl-CoA synthetase (AMP-forming)/AMP-acid ligase II